MTNEKLEQNKKNEQMVKVEQIKEEFVNIFTANIKRDGAKELLDFILLTDFFTAQPAQDITAHMRAGWPSTALRFTNAF